MTETGSKTQRLAGPGLALGSMVSIQLGAAIAVPVMVAHGSFGITAMRLACAAVAMLCLVRPFRRFDRRQWMGALALGGAMTLMTMSYFEAITLIPMGPAVTIDFLGPLTVAVVALRGWSRFVLPLLAALGVFVIAYGPGGWLFQPLGMLVALLSAIGWAAYIVLTRRVGRLFSGQDGLALAIIVAGVAALAVAAIAVPAELTLRQLPAAAALALLAPLIPFSLEMMALRRMEIGAFSMLLSLEPALGALFGLMVLRQTLSLQQIAGVAAVITASAAAVSLQPRPGAVAGAAPAPGSTFI